jgi:hypothetical protein
VGKASREPQWLLNLTTPLEILYNSISSKLGQPQEVNTMDHLKVDFTQIIRILDSSSADELVNGGQADQTSN